MALSAEERRNKQIEQANRARERAIAKQLAKLNDPEYKKERLEKQRVAADRQRARQLAKQQDPEYREKQFERSRNQQLKRQQPTTSKPVARKPIKKIANRGLKGRAANAVEREIMDKIGSLPCICCLLKGRHRPLVSLHHMDGRVKELAHAKVLPLCAEHHDTPATSEMREQYPDLVPFHSRGTTGGAKQWREFHGCEWEMLALVYHLVGLEPLFELPQVPIERAEGVKFFV